MQTVNIHEAKTQLSRYVDQAAAGEEVTIARAGKPVARLVPLQAAKNARQLGLGKALYKLPVDFDNMQSDAIQVMFEEKT